MEEELRQWRNKILTVRILEPCSSCLRVEYRGNLVAHLLNTGVGLYDFYGPFNSSVLEFRLHFPLKSTMKKDSIKPHGNNMFQEFGHAPQSQPGKLLLCQATGLSSQGWPAMEAPPLNS